MGQCAAGVNPSITIALASFGKLRPLRFSRRSSDGLRHDRGEKARPETISLIKTDMFRTLCKREEARVRHFPLFKAVEDGLHQLLPDAFVPQSGPHRERTEEADAAPSRSEV